MSYELYYDLSITRNYVSSWGVPEAVRELLQNAIDNPNGFSTEIGEDSLTISNPNTCLPKSSLLLGSSSKIEGGRTVGQFGEGYKIALLVLLRNNISVRIRNDGVLWTPVFRHSKQFREEVLSVRETKDSKRGLTVEIEGLSQEDLTDIIKNTLCLQGGDAPEGMKTSKGYILRDRPGKLYVNGLFVCDTWLNFGYNIKPEFLKLDRDRKTVSTFDLKHITKYMWDEVGDPQEIAALLETGCPDVDYLGVSAKVSNACHELFVKTYPGTLAALDQDEADNIKALYNREAKILPYPFIEFVKSSSEYNDVEIPDRLTPHDILTQWLADNINVMGTTAIDNFDALVELSETWRN